MNAVKAEKARSRHRIEVATPIIGNKKKGSQPEFSLMKTNMVTTNNSCHDH